MKFLIVLCAVVAAAFAYSQKNNGIECTICKMFVATSENWLGHEGEAREAAAIAECIKVVVEIEKNQLVAQFLCNTYVKPKLDEIIQHMEDNPSDQQDAAKVCTAVKMC
uniref:Saposin B-type domain-containing protein n=1 Tax=Plectus sambesii TaxID=2011161 RepID=A0A914UL00_9BILA